MLSPDYAAQAAAPATPRAYALLFAPPDRRDALTALYALDVELDAASSPRLEHAVAHTKLGWWRAEVDRLRAGRPEHPISKALHALAGAAPDWALLHERLTGADLRLAAFAPASDAEFDALLYRTHGALQQLAAQIAAGARAPELDRFGALLGRGVGHAEALRDLRQDAADGAPRVPRERLAAAGLAPAALAGPTPPAARAALGALADRGRGALADARASLAPAARPAQSHGLALAALHEQLLDVLARAHYDASERRSAHPLRQLFTAWRAARRARLTLDDAP
jgi:phytoene synthase